MKKLFVSLALIVCLRADQSIENVFGAVPCLPKDVVTHLSDWFKDNDYVVKNLIVQQGELADYQKSHVENNVLLKQKNICNLSRYNYVFECPSVPGYVIKISGPVNRFVNTIVSHGLWPSIVTKDDIASMKKVVTCQTASSFPVYLLYARLTKMQNLKHVYIPKTYLFKVPGTSDIIADTSYILVQEKIDLLDSEQAKNRLKSLNIDQVRELAITISSCGLWDIKDKINFARDGRIVIVDLEQPNVSNITRGFNIQDINRFKQNASCALNDLKKIVDKAYEKLIDKCAEGVLK